MLVPQKTSEHATSRHLFDLWAERYRVKLQGLDLENSSTQEAIQKAASIKGKVNIGAKFPQAIVKFKSQLAGLQARVLYQYTPEEVDLEEARTIAESTYRIYWKALQIYQKPTAQGSVTLPELKGLTSIPLAMLGLPDIATVANELETVLLECQDQHIQSRDWRTLGFLTTQFSIANKLLLDDPHLNIIEKRFLMPYFTFIEEQVALPWQRVCIAAAKYEADDPSFKIVERMFPRAAEISKEINQKLIQKLPTVATRRGKLSVNAVTHSTVRDFCMFQAYLWLCLLDQSTVVLTEELLTLCIMVLPSMKVKWVIIEESLKIFTQEITDRLDSEEIKLVEPYLKEIMNVFSQSRPMFELDSTLIEV